MNKLFWKTYYQEEKKLKKPTDFAKFCNKKIIPDSKIIELGSGNGRDSYYFGRQGYKVIGIDYAIKPNNADNVSFIKQNVIDFLKNYVATYDVIYSRFFLHSINKKEFEDVIKLSSKLFMAEMRSINDISFVNDHKRNLIDSNILLAYLIKKGYKILYFKEGKDMAIYKNQNPEIIRIIAKRQK